MSNNEQYVYDDARAQQGLEYFMNTPLKGSGVIVGINATRTQLLQLVWHSDIVTNHRVRRLRPVQTEYGDALVTEVFDSSLKKVSKPYTSLRKSIVTRKFKSHAVHHVATTGNKTDELAAFMGNGGILRDSDGISTEDDPIHTPRVTAVVHIPTEDTFTKHQYRTRNREILTDPLLTMVGKTIHGEGKPYIGFPRTYLTREIAGGVALCAHQYDGYDAEGQPQVFSRLPYVVPLRRNLLETMYDYADRLNSKDTAVAIGGVAINTQRNHYVREVMSLNSELEP